MIMEHEGDDKRVQIDFDRQKVLKAFIRNCNVIVEIEGAGLYRVEAEKLHMIENGMVLLFPVVRKADGNLRNDENLKDRMLDWGGIVMREDEDTGHLSFWADATNNPQLIKLVWDVNWEPDDEMRARFAKDPVTAETTDIPLPLPPPAPPAKEWYKGV